jgi:hypothetical protein
MTSKTYNTIRAAILAKQNISGDYKGYHRIMTPHTLGHKHGNEQCLFYQFAGESSSASVFPENSPANWRCITLDELDNVSAFTADDRLHTCTRHTQGQTCVGDVDVEMEF